jgi:azurin
MKRALFLFAGAAVLALPIHLSAQAAQTAKPAPPAAKPAAAAAGRVIEITATDTMKFSVTNIEAKPNEALTIRLKVVSAMQKIAMAHNFVLLKLGAKADTFANEAIMAGASKEYLPAARKADILASSKLIGGGETVDVSFKAPAKAGSYTYLCTFPGHFATGMKGTLVVK